MEYFDITRVDNFPRTNDKFLHLFDFQADQALVNRNGYTRFYYTGRSTPELLDPFRAIDDLQHVGLGVTYIRYIEIFYGLHFPEDRRGSYFDLSREVFRQHETPEVITLDKVDNGTSNRQKKDEIEEKITNKYLSYFPDSYAVPTKMGLKSFRDQTSFAYGVDKFMFLYGQYWKRRHDIRPDLTKPLENEELSNQDLCALRQVGTDSPFDIVVARFLVQTKNVFERPIFIGHIESMYNLVFPDYPYFGQAPDSIKKLY